MPFPSARYNILAIRWSNKVFLCRKGIEVFWYLPLHCLITNIWYHGVLHTHVLRSDPDGTSGDARGYWILVTAVCGRQMNWANCWRNIQPNFIEFIRRTGKAVLERRVLSSLKRYATDVKCGKVFISTREETTIPGYSRYFTLDDWCWPIIDITSQSTWLLLHRWLPPMDSLITLLSTLLKDFILVMNPTKGPPLRLNGYWNPLSQAWEGNRSPRDCSRYLATPLLTGYNELRPHFAGHCRQLHGWFLAALWNHTLHTAAFSYVIARLLLLLKGLLVLLFNHHTYQHPRLTGHCLIIAFSTPGRLVLSYWVFPVH